MDLTGNPNEQNFTRLTLHWQPPLQPNGDILRYRIYYSTNANASLDGWKSVFADGLKLTKEISGLQPGATYYFRMQARTKKGWGPLSRKKKISVPTSKSSVVEIQYGRQSSENSFIKQTP